MGLKLSGKYFRSMAMEYSAGECLHFHQWRTMAGALPFKEKLRNFFFSAWKIVFFGVLNGNLPASARGDGDRPFLEAGGVRQQEERQWMKNVHGRSKLEVEKRFPPQGELSITAGCPDRQCGLLDQAANK